FFRHDRGWINLMLGDFTGFHIIYDALTAIECALCFQPFVQLIPGEFQNIDEQQQRGGERPAPPVCGLFCFGWLIAPCHARYSVCESKISAASLTASWPCSS